MTDQMEKNPPGELVRALGLDSCPPFYRDGLFFMAVLAGGVFWLILWLFIPIQPMTMRQVWSWEFFSLTLGQPLAEELLFRGGLQGQLCRQTWGRHTWGGVTVANGITSVLFMLGHWWHHPPLWAMAVLGPSLLYGYFRDCYQSIYPSMTLHVLYNVGYFVLTGIP